MNLEEFLNQENVPSEIINITNQIIEIENQLLSFKKLENQAKELKEQLKLSMQKNNISKWTTLNGTQITLIPDKEDKEEEIAFVNEEKFYKENKELVDTYKTTRLNYTEHKIEFVKGKKGYVKITPKKEENEKNKN